MDRFCFAPKGQKRTGPKFRGGILEQIQLPEQYFGIVYAMIQTVKSGKIYNNGKEVEYDIVPEETREAVRRALNGEDPTEQLLWDEAVSKGVDPEYYAEGGALFFMTDDCFKSMGLENKVKVYVNLDYHVVFKIWG